MFIKEDEEMKSEKTKHEQTNRSPSQYTVLCPRKIQKLILKNQLKNSKNRFNGAVDRKAIKKTPKEEKPAQSKP